FGFGGANAHIVLEEYINPTQSTLPEHTSQLIILSAKNKERLNAYIKNIIDVLNNNISLANLAYTLQIGREAMDERLAMVVDSLDELKEKLNQYIQGKTDIDDFYHGNIKSRTTQSNILLDGKAGEAFMKVVIEEKELNKLSQLWISGVNIDWQLLYPTQKPQRISLPTYPFARERYWMAATSKVSSNKIQGLHPLIDQINPKLSLNQGIVFQKHIKKTDLIVTDHKIRKIPILPGVGYLEMAYAAACLVKENTRMKLVRIVWQQPIAVPADSRNIQIFIKKDKEQLTYQIKSSQGTHATGELHLASTVQEQRVTIKEIKARCQNHIDKKTFYNSFIDRGIQYGAYFQGVNEAWGNTEEALSRIRLPLTFESELQQYTLHPTLMDAALQTIAGIGSLNEQSLIPFAVEEVEILQPLSAHCYAYVKAIGQQRFQIAILDETGLVCVKFHELSLRTLSDPFENLFYAPRWISTPISRMENFSTGKRILIVHPQNSLDLEKAIAACHPQDEIRFLQLGMPFESLDHIHIIYYLGGIHSQHIDINDLDALEESQESGVISLFRLIKALNHQDFTKLQLNVITNDVFSINSQENRQPFAASLYGLSKVIDKEYPQITVRCIDLKINENINEDELIALVHPILSEPDLNGKEVVYRERKRYIRRISKIKLPAINPTSFKYQGVYLILGGAGGIGLELSLYLAQTVQARLILLGRSKLDATRLEKISQIEAKGGKVLYIQADAT
ncbi:MAG: polyketide synthase dehydratase domain-containing protein, partial [Thiotrichaceae bacterium]|nr:polyketide synthase dehydratase domain-containing protein [Thiotrichaceae bacterium]